MKKTVSLLSRVALVSFISTSFAYAAPATDALGVCLGDKTTGRDRKDLVAWIYANMSAHPEMQSISEISLEHRESLDRKVAALYTSLLVDRCAVEAKLAFKVEGAVAFEKSFGELGKLAMQELMADSEVKKSFATFTKYLDEAKLASVLRK